MTARHRYEILLQLQITVLQARPRVFAPLISRWDRCRSVPVESMHGLARLSCPGEPARLSRSVGPQDMNPANREGTPPARSQPGTLPGNETAWPKPHHSSRPDYDRSDHLSSDGTPGFQSKVQWIPAL